VTTPDAELAGDGRACGWYDSSHELQRGLEVTEYRGVEGLAKELPVTVWLSLTLNTQVAAHDGNRPAG
jgi:hypothetical protein